MDAIATSFRAQLDKVKAEFRALTPEQQRERIAEAQSGRSLADIIILIATREATE
jgi:hypothetical protein